MAGRIRIAVQGKVTSAIGHGLRMLIRDLHTVLGEMPEMGSHPTGWAQIVIRYVLPEDGCPDEPEAFGFRFKESASGPCMEIIGRDELALVYGMLYFTERYLGVQPFWFWADQCLPQQKRIEIACESYDSLPSKVRFRGWFVNDEVCLIGWKEPYPPTREVWLHVFEALLRCRGNMVIPGTDLPKTGVHFEVAEEMGLWITHHHAEPLGAEMFLRAYPGKNASYKEAPELFERLWTKAIEKQKDKKILWVLSFRGQGDKPFWENDPSFDTPEKRGAMISRVIRKQYDMIGAAVKEPVYCAALYGEIAELYKEGYVELPDDVIKVWADNGYGRMVSRRHGNLNLRIPSLPAEEDTGKHGIYYHVTFHDLQASNHLTMFPGSAAFIRQEVEGAFAAGADQYLLLNCGNIRPHVYMLDLLRVLWNEGKVDAEAHLEQFVSSYYTSGLKELAGLYRSYTEAAVAYGPNPDDLAGDEYYHHPARRIIGHWLQGQGAVADERLLWATGECSFLEQVRSFEQRCSEGLAQWTAWLDRCDKVIAGLAEEDKQRAADHLRFHGALHRSGCEGFLWLCRAYAAYAEGRYPQAFVCASLSMRGYEEGLHVLRAAEHGKWNRFYSADWLTNIESTVRNVDTVRRFLRMHGDSPEFFLWYKEFLMPETEKHIYLENTHRNPLSDDELAERLHAHFEQNGQLL
ncbi:hypothetical protein CF651_26645 [Paenibacillus rigui]|uniref:Glycosyl hydrolase family 115 n=1 Tax=Paenibacillus rigui TaxID=554312 RepID=A0A229UJ19_9BACL|nr:hypothetical protein CF651_26645 [Paenibacillus rigui]